METQADRIEPRSGKFPQAVIWIAGIAVTLFSAVGIAALMGWIPNSTGRAGDTAAVGLYPANTVPPAAPIANRAVAPRPAPADYVAPARVERGEQVEHIAPARVAAVATCAECGVVESVREIDAKGQGSGLGAVGGGVVGGLLGNQMGGGRGKSAMTVVGVVGGALAGNEVEKRVKTTKSYKVTVRMNDGSNRVISEAHLPSWRTGDKVKIIDGAIHSNA